MPDVFAFTASAYPGYYPPYLNFTLQPDGSIQVIARSAEEPAGVCGMTVVSSLPPEQVDLLREWLNGLRDGPADHVVMRSG